MNDEGASVQLPPHQQLVRSDQWPLVGERQAAAGPAEWSLALAGEVVRPRRWSLAEFAALPQTAVVVDIHCVTRWSKLGVEFRGVLLRDVLAQVEATDRARFVSFIARSDRGHSTSLPLADALELGTLLATHVDGELLPAEHGGPLRSVVPHRYFYKSLKWLERIELLAENRLGYWEAEAGYHDRADPWREERYMAADIDRRWARRLIESRDFSGQALRSIDCALRELSGLKAAGAQLRDANFSAAQLERADFSGANLSNARFREARLVDATLAGADLEGAELAGADLRGADLRGASLFGATFVDGPTAARFDARTAISPASIAQLTDSQRQFVERALAAAEAAGGATA